MSEIHLSDYNNFSDEDLVLLINKGDYGCFGALIERLMPHIVSEAKKWESMLPDTEDLVEEGVLAVFSAVKSYKKGKATFKTYANLLVDRAIGVKVKAAGANKRIPNSLLSSIDEIDIPQGENPEEILIRKEEESDFKNLLKANLSSLEYDILNLYLGGSSYSDIAKKLGVTVKSVDSALQRIRLKFKR